MLIEYKTGNFSLPGQGSKYSQEPYFRQYIPNITKIRFLFGKMKLAFEYELSRMKWADIQGLIPTNDGSLPTKIDFNPGTSDNARLFTAKNNRISAVMVYNF